MQRIIEDLESICLLLQYILFHKVHFIELQKIKVQNYKLSPFYEEKRFNLFNAMS